MYSPVFYPTFATAHRLVRVAKSLSRVTRGMRVACDSAAEILSSRVVPGLNLPHPNIPEPIDLDPDMPPDYESESFWDKRFKNEKHFEWLGNGHDTVLPVLRRFLEGWMQNFAEPPSVDKPLPKVLHIGAGTSTLSNGILQVFYDLLREKGGLEPGISMVVNTDFAEQAVLRGNQTDEVQKGEAKWEKVDLLRWKDIQRLQQTYSFGDTEILGGVFEVVVDKSTSDAISCGDKVTFSKNLLTGLPENSVHPYISSCMAQLSGKFLAVEPLQVLALHLASLVKPGGIWVALSYSSDRFPLLVSPAAQRPEVGDLMDASRYWEVQEVKSVGTPLGWGKQGNAFVPDIKHYLYVFQRTNASL